MKKLLLSSLLVVFGKFLTAQIIYIQETDMYGNPYIISYPINVQEPSFNRTYDATGYHMYYDENKVKYSYENKQTTNPLWFSPSSISDKDFRDMMKSFEYIPEKK